MSWDAEIAAAREHAGEPMTGERVLAWSIVLEALVARFAPAEPSGLEQLAGDIVDALVARHLLRV